MQNPDMHEFLKLMSPSTSTLMYDCIDLHVSDAITNINNMQTLQPVCFTAKPSTPAASVLQCHVSKHRNRF